MIETEGLTHIHLFVADPDGLVRSQAVQLINELARDPKPARAKELHDRPNIYRIWLAGRWRIVYEVDDEQIVILILRVRRKEDIDYPSL